MTWEEIADARLREIHRLRGEIRKANEHIDRRNDLLLQAMGCALKQANQRFRNWREICNWLLAELDITKQELEAIYDSRNAAPYIENIIEELKRNKGE